jgi:hypothetical protein
MLPNPVQNEEEKLKPEKWRPIILTNAMYRIAFGIIARWFQDLHKERTDDEEKGIVADEQKGFLRIIQDYNDGIAKIQFFLAHAKGNNKPIYFATLDSKDALSSVSHEKLEQTPPNWKFKNVLKMQ